MAVLNLVPHNVNPSLAMTVTDLLKTALIKTGSFYIIDTKEMNQYFKDNTGKNNDCIDTACAVEIGSHVNADKVCIGSFIKLGTSYIINIRIVDVTGKAATFADKVKIDNESEIETACDTLINKLTTQIMYGNSKTISHRLQVHNYPFRQKTYKYGHIEQLQDKNVLMADIGEINGVKKRMLYRLYLDKARYKIGEVTEVNSQNCIITFNKPLPDITLKARKNILKYKGQRKVFSFGPVFSFNTDFNNSSTYGETGYPSFDVFGAGFAILFNIFHKSGLGLEVSLGFYNLTSETVVSQNEFIPSSNFIQQNDLHLKISDTLYFPVLLTYNFFQNFMLSPYIGIGAGFYQSKITYSLYRKNSEFYYYYYDYYYQMYDTPLKTLDSIAPVFTIGLNAFKTRRVNLTTSVKVMPLNTLDNFRTSQDFLLLYIFSFGATFNF
jgi:hypothetical protein